MTQQEAVRKKMEEAYKGQDTESLLNHIAWTDVILPKIQKERELYQSLLVQAVLGVEPTVKDVNGHVHKISREHLAGRIAGLDYIMKLFERILRDGERAVEELRTFGINT